MALNEVLILNNFRDRRFSLHRPNNMNRIFSRGKVLNSIEKLYIRK